MASESVPHFSCIQIEELGCMVHAAAGHEIARIMESNAPHGLNMILECVSASCVDEIPNLDRAVP